MPSRSRLRPNVAGIGWVSVGIHAGMTISVIGGKTKGRPDTRRPFAKALPRRKAIGIEQGQPYIAVGHEMYPAWYSLESMQRSSLSWLARAKFRGSRP